MAALKSKIFPLVRLIIDFRSIFFDLTVTGKRVQAVTPPPHILPGSIPSDNTVALGVISAALHLNLSVFKNLPLHLHPSPQQILHLSAAMTVSRIFCHY